MRLTKKDLIESIKNDKPKLIKGITKRELEQIVSNVLNDLIIEALEFIKEDLQELQHDKEEKEC